MNQRYGREYPAFQRNNVPIMLQFDNYYAPYGGVCIQSIIDTSSKEYNYDITILELEISDDNKALIKSLSSGKENISIRFFSINNFLESSDEPNIKRFAQCMNKFPMRVILPYIFPCYPKIVTCDIDLLVRHDLAELINLNIDNSCFAAVKDITWAGMVKKNHMWSREGTPIAFTGDYIKEILKIAKPLDYCNAGVKVLECTNFREYRSMETILEEAYSDKYLLNEQDYLNVLFEDRIKFINLTWNFQVAINEYIENIIQHAPEDLKQEYWEASKNPYIIHWAGVLKPYICPDMKLGYLWWQTAMKTPFVPHIFARMVDGLNVRQEHYLKKYGKRVAVWDPIPKGVKRNLTGT